MSLCKAWASGLSTSLTEVRHTLESKTIPLVIIYGRPASGKLTIARELSRLTKLKLFHNHLTVDLLLSVFEFGSPAFVTLREQIWLSVICEACAAKTGLIFTFTPERTVSGGFLNRLVDEATSFGADVRLVEVVCSEDQIEKRLESSSRKQFGKLHSVEEYRTLKAAGAFAVQIALTPDLTIDTSVTEPRTSAARIADIIFSDSTTDEVSA
jgi:chloramphenicol 3-O-phosphotransferase